MAQDDVSNIRNVRKCPPEHSNELETDVQASTNSEAEALRKLQFAFRRSCGWRHVDCASECSMAEVRKHPETTASTISELGAPDLEPGERESEMERPRELHGSRKSGRRVTKLAGQ